MNAGMVTFWNITACQLKLSILPVVKSNRPNKKFNGYHDLIKVIQCCKHPRPRFFTSVQPNYNLPRLIYNNNNTRDHHILRSTTGVQLHNSRIQNKTKDILQRKRGRIDNLSDHGYPKYFCPQSNISWSWSLIWWAVSPYTAQERNKGKMLSHVSYDDDNLQST